MLNDVSCIFILFCGTVRPQVTAPVLMDGMEKARRAMTAMVGGDLEQLQVLEQEFRGDAQAVAHPRAGISSGRPGRAWTGPAANQFREEWNGNFAAALN